jgi:hypothetical protein
VDRIDRLAERDRPSLSAICGRAGQLLAEYTTWVGPVHTGTVSPTTLTAQSAGDELQAARQQVHAGRG